MEYFYFFFDEIQKINNIDYTYIYILIFFVNFVGCFLFFNFITPYSSITILLYALYANNLDLGKFFFVAFAGSVLGNTCNFILSKKISVYIMPFLIKNKIFLKSNNLFSKYHIDFLSISFFLGPVKSFAVFLSAINKIPPKRFYFLNCLYSFIWIGFVYLECSLLSIIYNFTPEHIVIKFFVLVAFILLINMIIYKLISK